MMASLTISNPTHSTSLTVKSKLASDDNNRPRLRIVHSAQGQEYNAILNIGERVHRNMINQMLRMIRLCVLLMVSARILLALMNSRDTYVDYYVDLSTFVSTLCIPSSNDLASRKAA